MNISNTLQETIKLVELASKRAKLLINATTDTEIYNTPDHIDFEVDRIYLVFSEKTNHDCPDSFSQTLYLSDLEMTDLEFNHKVEIAIQERNHKIEQRKIQLEQEKLNSKQQQYLKLKEELGL